MSNQPENNEEQATTDNLDEVKIRSIHTDGGYNISTGTILSQIAETAIDYGCRVPRDLQATAQAEGYSRTLVATIYAPHDNPYTAIGAVLDNLCIDNNNITVEFPASGADFEDKISAVLFTKEDKDTADAIKNALKNIHWNDTQTLPEQLDGTLGMDADEWEDEIEEITDFFDNEYLFVDAGHIPASAWEYQSVRLSIYQEADRKVFA